jgi:two-component system phosphate regulon response regulator PhoB
MAKERIFVVEDEEDIQELIRYNLEREGYTVRGVTSGEAALAAIKDHPPDLVLLDIMLPGKDGLDICRTLKAEPKTRAIPVIMLTAKGEEADIVTGLELGADDYVTKPFSPRVLVARIRTVLRRLVTPAPDEGDVLRVHDVVIHPGRHEVRVGEESVELTFTEFRILTLLARRPGWVFTRTQIVDRVHGDDYPVTERSVDVQIVSLRKKLGSAGTYIETVRGVGYRFKE